MPFPFTDLNGASELFRAGWVGGDSRNLAIGQERESCWTAPAPRTAVWWVHSRALLNHPLLASAAAKENSRPCLAPNPGEFDSATAVGWGYKRSGKWAQHQAKSGRARSFLLLEDGFIRSLLPGYGHGALYSLALDRKGIYYDSGGRSDLISLLESAASQSEPLQAETPGLLERWRESGVSKYNWFTGRADDLDQAIPDPGVLVVDQTRGDCSLTSAFIADHDFAAMLAAALEENEGPVYVRSHPDHLFRNKFSCLRTSPLLRHPRVRLVPCGWSPSSVFARVSKVYVMSSLLGLEALLHRKKVIHFGRAFYGGWGLTEDRHPLCFPRGGQPLHLEGLFEACYLRYTRYFDPDHGHPAELGRILDHLALQRAFHEENAKTSWDLRALNPWKRNVIRRFLVTPFPPRPEGMERATVRWGSQGTNGATEKTVLRVEDGFIRSRGLGAEFHLPVSLVLDPLGIYYDAHRPSLLEDLLLTHNYTEKERTEASELIQELLDRRVSKYNLGTSACRSIRDPWAAAIPSVKHHPSRERILVVGQVEADASLSRGRARFSTNLQFLLHVRSRYPDAILAYKPHPDVVRHLRPGRPACRETIAACDHVIASLDILPWLQTCNSLHTQTSLSGFEAMLRGVPVHCYGVPFYAGWGLTFDHGDVPERRKSRSVRLEELVYTALVQYPRYLNPETNEFTSVFHALRLMDGPPSSRISPPPLLARVTQLKRMFRWLRQIE